MIYPDIRLEEWLEAHGLVVVDYKCPRCGGVFPTEVPVLMKDCAGLESRVHECGREYTEVILTPRTSRARKFWGKVIGRSCD